LSLAEKQTTTDSLLVTHRVMGLSLLLTGNPAGARVHQDRAITVYDTAQHQKLAMRFGVDIRVTSFVYRSLAQWLLGYPNAARQDAEDALKEAREIGHAGTAMVALAVAPITFMLLGNYVTAGSLLDELAQLADQKDAIMWKAMANMIEGCLSALTDDPSHSMRVTTSGILASNQKAAAGQRCQTRPKPSVTRRSEG
jgi:hypothetical protein